LEEHKLPRQLQASPQPPSVNIITEISLCTISHCLELKSTPKVSFITSQAREWDNWTVGARRKRPSPGRVTACSGQSWGPQLVRIGDMSKVTLQDSWS